MEYKQHGECKRQRFHNEFAEDEGINGIQKKFIVELYSIYFGAIINCTNMFGIFFIYLVNVSLGSMYFDNADNRD